MTAVPTHSALRILGRAWPVMLAVVLGLALAQALLIIGQPATALEPGFVLRVLGSLIAIGVAGWLLTAAATSAADGVRFSPNRPAVALWAASTGLASAGAWILSPFATPFVLVVGLWLMPATVEAGSVRAALGLAGRHPLRFVAAVLVTLVLSALAWAAGLVAGFFVTGPLGTFLAWLVAGALAAVVLAMWTALARRR